MSNVSYPGQKLLSLEEAEAILSPYRDRLSRCIQHGWDAWSKDYVGKHHILNARARAAIIFDEIAHRALEEFPTGPGLKAVRSASTLMLYIGESLTLRFKKIRKNGRCCNILTKQQILFRAQVQISFPTMLDGTLVSAGYTLDDLQQNLLRKSIVCHRNNELLWELSLSSPVASLVEFAAPLTTSVEEERSRFEPKPELVHDSPSIKISGKDE